MIFINHFENNDEFSSKTKNLLDSQSRVRQTIMSPSSEDSKFGVENLSSTSYWYLKNSQI